MRREASALEGAKAYRTATDRRHYEVRGPRTTATGEIEAEVETGDHDVMSARMTGMSSGGEELVPDLETEIANVGPGINGTPRGHALAHGRVHEMNDGEVVVEIADKTMTSGGGRMGAEIDRGAVNVTTDDKGGFGADHGHPTTPDITIHDETAALP